jgi:hypothetical protein
MSKSSYVSANHTYDTEQQSTYVEIQARTNIPDSEDKRKQLDLLRDRISRQFDDLYQSLGV